MNSGKLFSMLTIVFLMTSGCSSTVMTGSWKAPNFNGQVKKVYVIGIAKQDTARRIFEDDFRTQLATYGVTGISSYNELPTSQEINKEVIAAKASANGADAIMIARTIGKRTEEVVNPGQITSYPRPVSRYGYDGRRGGYFPDPYYRNYGSYYSQSRNIIYQPVRNRTQDSVFLLLI